MTRKRSIITTQFRVPIDVYSVTTKSKITPVADVFDDSETIIIIIIILQKWTLVM